MAKGDKIPRERGSGRKKNPIFIALCVEGGGDAVCVCVCACVCVCVRVRVF